MAKPMAASSFTVGWVCALPVELAAAAVMMDEEYDDLPQPTADTNIYSYGRIGVHYVVAACLPAGQMGNNQAAVVASQMRNSFPCLRFGVLIGIGGGVPSDEHDIRLGDVVISQPAGQHGGVVQFDFGKTGPDGRIARTGSLNTPPTILLNALAKLRANDLRGKARVNDHLSAFSSLRKFLYPGPEKDTLYTAVSQHVPGPTCAKCNHDDIIHRDARDALEPALFFGNIASGNQVMKDAPTRDRISQELGGILCFEMEAAGLMNNFPCLVIRGVCDYADAHKNKQWQPYAAATAAACAKELLRMVPQTILTGESQQEDFAPKVHFIVPFGRNGGFVGRETIVKRVVDLASPDSNTHDCQRLVIEGLGGVGKTQVALEVAYRVREEDPDCSVFWVPAVDRNTFETAYREIGQILRLPGVDEDKADVKALVKSALSKSDTKWLLVIDNADDTDLILGIDEESALRDYLPFNRNGSILFTSRNHKIGVKLDIPITFIVRVSEMTMAEAILMFQRTLEESQRNDNEKTVQLIEYLAFLPLAIKQASAYMAETGASTSEYLELCHDSDKSQIELLSTNFGDRGRYNKIANPVATTWLISFRYIARSDPLAMYYLKFACFMAQKGIPKSLLPSGGNKIEDSRAFGVLRGYAFISERENGGSFDIHRLIRLATINWIRDERAQIITAVIQQLAFMYPVPQHENRVVWMRYMPHILAAVEVVKDCTDLMAWANLASKVGNSHLVLGQYKEAEQMYLQTSKLCEEVLGAKHPDTLSSMNNLGLVLDNQGKYDEAEQIHRQTLKLWEEVLGAKHPDTLGSMNNLGLVLDNQGEYDEAGQIHRQTLRLKEEVLGAKHPATLSSMNNLGLVLDNQGKYDEAEQIHRQTLKLKEEVLGAKHPATLSSMNNLGLVLDKQGKYDEAEQIHRQTLKLREEVLGPKHPDTLTVMDDLSRVVRLQAGQVELMTVNYNVPQDDMVPKGDQEGKGVSR